MALTLITTSTPTGVCKGCGGNLPEGRKAWCTAACRTANGRVAVQCRAPGCTETTMIRRSWAQRDERVYCPKHHDLWQKSDLPWRETRLYVATTGEYGKVGVSSNVPRRLKEIGSHWSLVAASQRLTYKDARAAELALKHRIYGLGAAPWLCRHGGGETFRWEAQIDDGLWIVQAVASAHHGREPLPLLTLAAA